MAASIRDMEVVTDVSEFRKADSEFHLAIAKASKNVYLRSAVEGARAGIFLPFDARDFTVTWSSSPADHMGVLDAMRALDGGRAAEEMEAHVDREPPGDGRRHLEQTGPLDPVRLVARRRARANCPNIR